MIMLVPWLQRRVFRSEDRQGPEDPGGLFMSYNEIMNDVWAFEASTMVVGFG